MRKTLQMLWDTFIVPVRDYRWCGWMFIVGLIAFYLDPQGLETMRVVLFVLFFWFLAGMLRKIFFPYRRITTDNKRVQMRLSDFFKMALVHNSIAAAIVVASMVFFMVAVAWSFIFWIR